MKRISFSEGATFAVFLYVGIALGLLVFTTAHEAGHFLVASIIKPSAISGFYFPVENIPKALIFQEQKNIPECENSAACVTYTASVSDSFGQIGGFFTSIAGVVATTILLFLSLRLKRVVEKGFDGKKTIYLAAASFLTGWFLAGFEISLGWGGDGAKAVFLFINNTTVALLIVLPISLILAFVCFFAILDMATLPIPILGPIREELKAVMVRYNVGFLIRH